MFSEGRMSDTMGIAGQIVDTTFVVGNSEIFTGVVDMSKWHKLLFIFKTGTWVDAETLVCRVVTCDSAGNNAAALKTASTRTADATANDSILILIEVDGRELPGTSNADRYVKGGMVSSAGGGSLGTCIVLGLDKHPPATNNDLAKVVEIETDLD